MIQEAMNYAVPLDTLLSDVRGVSLSTGSPDMYEQLLLKARDTYPYLARAFNIRLADYYQFRTNGPMMVEYARRLLTTTPGTGTDVAMDVAQVTLMTDDLNALPQSVSLSKKTVRMIWENLFWAFIYNIVCIPIAAGVLYLFFENPRSCSYHDLAFKFTKRLQERR